MRQHNAHNRLKTKLIATGRHHAKSFSHIHSTTEPSYYKKNEKFPRTLSEDKKLSILDLPWDILQGVYHCNPHNLIELNTVFAKITRKNRKGLRFKHGLPDDQNSRDFITKTIQCCRGLRIIDFTNCGHILNALTLNRISQLRTYDFPLSLEFVSFKNCKYITDSSLKSFLIRIKAIRALDLRGCNQLSSTSLRHINTLTKLQFLALGNNSSNVKTRLDCDALSFLFSKPQSRKENLSILNDSNSNNSLIPNSNPGNWKSKLILLALKNTNIDYFSLLFHTCDNLKYLDLSGSKLLNDSTSSFLKYMRNLKVLSLSGCPILQGTFDDISRFCTKLQYLDLSNTNLDSQSLTNLSLNLKLLQVLKLIGCKKINDDSIRNLLINCNYISKLDIAGCINITPRFLIQPLNIRAGKRFKFIGISECSFSVNEIYGSLVEAGADNVIPKKHVLGIDKFEDLLDLFSNYSQI